MDSSIIYRYLLVLFIFTFSQVQAIEFQGNFTQGHFVLGKTDPKAKIKVGKKVKVKFVKDRPGHDYRYAINSNKIKNELKWKPIKRFADGLEETFEWYLLNYKFFNFFSKKKFFKRLGLSKWLKKE